MTTSTTDQTLTDLPQEGDEVQVLEGEHKGKVGIVCDRNPNPNWKQDGETWSELRRLGAPEYSTFGWIEDPSKVRILRRKADIPTPDIPTFNELRTHLASAAHSGFGDGLTIDETDTNEPDGQFMVMGTSATGMPFQARVTINYIEQADF